MKVFCNYPNKKKRRVCFCRGKQKKRLKWLVLLFLLLYLPTQSMQLFVGTDCATAMKKPNNTKSCSYCSGRERGREELPGDSLSRRRRRKRRRGLKKKAKNYAKTGPTFAVATANTETKETKKQKSVHRNKQLQQQQQQQHLARYFVVCLPPP